MPTHPTVTNSRLNNILVCLIPTITLLNEVNDTFGTPFIKAISNTTLSLVTAVQNIKRNKDQCVQLMENIHQILHAIINLHLTPKTAGKTLHKIHTFVNAQQDGNRLKYFFRQSEMNTLHKDCFEGLEEAVKFFMVEAGFHLVEGIAEWQQKTQKMHQELLELVTHLSDRSTCDTASSIYLSTAGSKTSSISFSFLPAQPKIFHGRQAELKNIVTSLTRQSACIAILGAGGIGKTSLAKAALHHPDVTTKYETQLFIAADSATTSIELASLIGSHLGLKPEKDLTKPVIQHLSRGLSCLLVLDNLETPWEPLESRGGVEEFLSLLTDIPHLALIITIRGTERPAKTLIEIADDCHDSKDIDRLLQLTDNMPLAVDLIAHLVDYEGSSSVLARWESEKTALLSVGLGKGASLDASIALSLASPRMASHTGAKDLLSLLSILPDGLSDVELGHCNLPIKDILACRAILLQISMAYRDSKNRLKSLVPIREHIKNFYPPSPLLFHPLCQYFCSLLDIYKKYEGLHQNDTGINQIATNFGNLQQVLLLELHPNNPDIIDAINCTLSLNSYAYDTGYGFITLMDHIPAVLPQPSNHRLEVAYVTEMLNMIYVSPNINPKLLIDGTMTHLQHCNDPSLESDFYYSAGIYYAFHQPDTPKSAYFCEQALSSARLNEDSTRQANALNQIARLKVSLGDLFAAKRDAHEAQEMAHISGNLTTQALALRTEMTCLIRLGNLTRAALLGHRARELVQLCGMEGGTLDDGIMVNLAQIHMLKSEYQEARNLHVQLQNKSGPQQEYFNAFTRMNIAEIDIILDTEFFDVQKNLENAKTTFDTLGFTGWLNGCEMMLADLSLREGKASIAENVLQQCFRAGSSSTQVYCLERLADVSRWTSAGITWSSTWTVIYLAFVHQGKRKLDLYKALYFLGDVFLSQEDEQTAHKLFLIALEGFTYMDIHRSRADCMLRLGDITKNRGTQQEALVQLSSLEAQLDKVSNLNEKSADTAVEILEKTPWVAA
ncbi:hypothetical protein C8R44DRAFT_924212 [Mycena epipterygia]|nr:hypothetical protein C8R44DRAFT_924212 [Mycena epipterygia]